MCGLRPTVIRHVLLIGLNGAIPCAAFGVGGVTTSDFPERSYACKLEAGDSLKTHLPPPPTWDDPRLNTLEGRTEIVAVGFREAMRFLCAAGNDLAINAYVDGIAGKGRAKSDDPILQGRTRFQMNVGTRRGEKSWVSLLRPNFRVLSGVAMRDPDGFQYFDDEDECVASSHLVFTLESAPLIDVRYDQIQRRANTAAASTVGGNTIALKPGVYQLHDLSLGPFPYPNWDSYPPEKRHFALGKFYGREGRDAPDEAVYLEGKQVRVHCQIVVFPAVFERRQLLMPGELGLDNPWAANPVEAATMVILHELSHFESYVSARPGLVRNKIPATSDDEATAWAFASSLIRYRQE